MNSISPHKIENRSVTLKTDLSASKDKAAYVKVEMPPAFVSKIVNPSATKD